jgi:hypothetical protein
MGIRVTGTLALALLAGSVVAQPSSPAPPAKPEPCVDCPPLPPGVSDGAGNFSIVTRDERGRAQRLDVNPAQAAARKLPLSDDARRAVEQVLGERERQLDTFVRDNLRDVLRLQSASSAGNTGEARRIVNDLRDKSDVLRRAGHLAQDLAPALTPEQNELLSRLVRDYWQALVRDESESARVRGDRFDMALFMSNESAAMTGAELRGAYTRVFGEATRDFDDALRALNLTPEQDFKVRKLAPESFRKSYAALSPEQRLGQFVEVLGTLTPEQREQLLVSVRGVREPARTPAEQTRPDFATALEQMGLSPEQSYRVRTSTPAAMQELYASLVPSRRASLGLDAIAGLSPSQRVTMVFDIYAQLAPEQREALLARMGSELALLDAGVTGQGPAPGDFGTMLRALSLTDEQFERAQIIIAEPLAKAFASLTPAQRCVLSFDMHRLMEGPQRARFIDRLATGAGFTGTPGMVANSPGFERVLSELGLDPSTRRRVLSETSGAFHRVFSTLTPLQRERAMLDGFDILWPEQRDQLVSDLAEGRTLIARVGSALGELDALGRDLGLSPDQRARLVVISNEPFTNAYARLSSRQRSLFFFDTWAQLSGEQQGVLMRRLGAGETIVGPVPKNPKAGRDFETLMRELNLSADLDKRVRALAGRTLPVVAGAMEQGQCQALAFEAYAMLTQDRRELLLGRLRDGALMGGPPELDPRPFDEAVRDLKLEPLQEVRLHQIVGTTQRLGFARLDPPTRTRMVFDALEVMAPEQRELFSAYLASERAWSAAPNLPSAEFASLLAHLNVDPSKRDAIRDAMDDNLERLIPRLNPRQRLRVLFSALELVSPEERTNLATRLARGQTMAGPIGAPAGDFASLLEDVGYTREQAQSIRRATPEALQDALIATSDGQRTLVLIDLYMSMRPDPRRLLTLATAQDPSLRVSDFDVLLRDLGVSSEQEWRIRRVGDERLGALFGRLSPARRGTLLIDAYQMLSPAQRALLFFDLYQIMGPGEREALAQRLRDGAVASAPSKVLPEFDKFLTDLNLSDGELARARTLLGESAQRAILSFTPQRRSWLFWDASGILTPAQRELVLGRQQRVGGSLATTGSDQQPMRDADPRLRQLALSPEQEAVLQTVLLRTFDQGYARLTPGERWSMLADIYAQDFSERARADLAARVQEPQRPAPIIFRPLPDERDLVWVVGALQGSEAQLVRTRTLVADTLVRSRAWLTSDERLKFHADCWGVLTPGQRAGVLQRYAVMLDPKHDPADPRLDLRTLDEELKLTRVQVARLRELYEEALRQAYLRLSPAERARLIADVWDLLTATQRQAWLERIREDAALAPRVGEVPMVGDQGR